MVIPKRKLRVHNSDAIGHSELIQKKSDSEEKGKEGNVPLISPDLAFL